MKADIFGVEQHGKKEHTTSMLVCMMTMSVKCVYINDSSASGMVADLVAMWRFSRMQQLIVNMGKPACDSSSGRTK